MLRTIYTELDLLVAECLRSGTFDELTAAELAACVAGAVYQARSSADVVEPHLPTLGMRTALTHMSALWRDLRAAEAQQKVSYLRDMDTGFCAATYLWASGASLDTVLEDGDFAAGDFVRWTKQVLDVLGQVGDAAAGTPLRSTARSAVDLLRAGWSRTAADGNRRAGSSRGEGCFDPTRAAAEVVPLVQCSPRLRVDRRSGQCDALGREFERRVAQDGHHGDGTIEVVRGVEDAASDRGGDTGRRVGGRGPDRRQVPVVRDQSGGRLVPDPGDAREPVGSVAAQGGEVGVVATPGSRTWPRPLPRP